MNWAPRGAATYRRRQESGRDSGEGDSTRGPRPARSTKGAWPTLVIEAGDSESQRRLRHDVRWWFDASDHDVKLVLLAKLCRRSGRISLEVWEGRRTTTRQGATTTRAASSRVALQQSIIITRNETTTPVSYVAGSPFVLDFGLLFLRAPGVGEQDVVISIADLQLFAELVWEVA